MGGIELRNDTLVVQREPNEFDELAVEFSSLLDTFDVEHVYVAGYVSILTGRSRSTEDIDVLVEPVDEATAAELVDALETAGYWGPAMPLSAFHEMLSGGEPIWVAPRETMAPHLEVKVVGDEFDRASLAGSITARIGEASIPIGPIELQIAYKLSLGSRTDVEDAVHLYTLFEETLSEARLVTWVERLGVTEEYERLKRS